MKSLTRILKKSDITATKLWFGLVSFGWAAYTLSDPNDEALRYLLHFFNYRIWAAAYAVHGVSILYGVLTGRKNVVLLITDGALGCFLWSTVGIIYICFQGVPGPSFVGSLIAIWLLVRYPSFNSPAPKDTAFKDFK